MPSNSTIATLDKQIARAEAELGRLAGREAKAKTVIETIGLIRQELDERIAYLNTIRSRKLAGAEPVAAADGETPVLNTELEPEPATVVSDDPRISVAV